MERLLGLPSQQKSTRGHTASTGAPGGPAASGSGPLAPHPLGRGAGPSCGVGWGCPGPCGLRWLACPFSVVCRGLLSALLLLPASSEVAVEFFGPLVSFVQNLSQLFCKKLFFWPLEFLCICCLRRHLSRHQDCSSGPQAPACLSLPRLA